MAKRPVFITKECFPFYEIKEIEFTYHSGFAVSQKQRSIKELHDGFRNQFDKNILEISTKSSEALGISLSALNLKMMIDEKEYSIENLFQGSKCFENGGPYTDLYKVNPWKVKKDPRLKESGAIIGFRLQEEDFSNEPKDYFYNWIYINGVYQHKDYLKAIREYDAFTDIEFNPLKSINCQAKAVAIAAGLQKAGLLDDCMKDRTVFLMHVYEERKENRYEQLSLFDMI